MAEVPKPYFNIKQTKRSGAEARTTLDNLHQIQMTNLNPVLIIPNYFYERYIFLNYSCYILST